MSKAEEAVKPRSAEELAQRPAEPNGLIGLALAPGSTDDFGSTLEVDTDQGMEVDDAYRLSIDEPEIQWRRHLDDGRSTYPSVPLHHRSLRPFDSISLNGSTRSLYDSDLDYYLENNRRYVSDYSQPNDAEEQLRMQIMHQVFLFLLKSDLTSIPLTNPTKILDIGTGTGDWVIGVGEAFPDAEVIGTDLSAIQPSAVPPNVFFEIFDAEDEDEWTYPRDYFDLVHFRNMTGSFKSWDKMYERSLRHLKPGGWIEVVDFDDQSKTFAKYFKKGSEMYNWYMALGEASIRSGKDVGPMHLDPERLSARGFVDVKITSHELPMGVWPEEPEVRSTAKLWLVACLSGIESVSLRLLTRDLGWEPDEVLRVCRNVEAALKNLAMDKEKAKGLSITVKILVGRKPTHNEYMGQQMDEVEVALEVDDAQPDGKRMKMDLTTDRREDQEAIPPASATDAEADAEIAKHEGHSPEVRNDLEMK